MTPSALSYKKINHNAEAQRKEENKKRLVESRPKNALIQAVWQTALSVFLCAPHMLEIVQWKHPWGAFAPLCWKFVPKRNILN